MKLRLSLLLAVSVFTTTHTAFADDAPATPPPAAGSASTTLSNEPADYGSGYNSWGVRGGATLGQGNGARAQLNLGGYGYGGGFGAFNVFGVPGYGFAGLEGMYILNLSENMDLAVGGRLPFWPFGLAPGAQLRYRVMNQGAFQLAIDAAVYVPMYFAGVGVANSFAIGVDLEPGVMGSYFIKDNMEIYFGLIVPIAFMAYTAFGTSTASIFFDIRGGFAYTLKKSNIGFYGNIDLVPGVFIPTGPGAAAGGFGFNFTGGAQFRFGG